MKKMAFGAYKIIFLFFMMAVPCKTFSSGMFQNIALRSVLKKITPKKIEKVTFWANLLAPIPYRFNNERKERQRIDDLKSLPKNEKSDELIQKTFSIDPSIIVVVPDDELPSTAALAYFDKILIQESFYEKLASNDAFEWDKSLGILGHECEHIKNGDTKAYGNTIFLTTAELFIGGIGVGLTGRLYRAGKTIVQAKQKMRSFVAAPIKGFLKSCIVHGLSGLIFLKKRRVDEYLADDIRIKDKAMNIKLLQGLKSELLDPEYKYNYFRNVEKCSENEIWLREKFLPHPDNNKRIERIDENINRRIRIIDKKMKGMVRY